MSVRLDVGGQLVYTFHQPLILFFKSHDTLI